MGGTINTSIPGGGGLTSIENLGSDNIGVVWPLVLVLFALQIMPASRPSVHEAEEQIWDS